MKEFLEQYQMTLTVRGPVFVGSGKEIMKKEYLFLPSKKKVGIMDIGKLYQMACDKGRQRRFEQFFLGSGRQDLRDWLDRERLLADAGKQCLSYVLDMDPASVVNGPMTIMACMKDAYGNPYVPGSTLKGMFRSILATRHLLENSKLRSSVQEKLGREISVKRSRNLYLSSTCRSMEEQIFRTMKREGTRPQDAVNDVLSGFVVSDSNPIAPNQLVLAQKVEYRTNGDAKTLNLWRESLRPGTHISFTVTVNRNLFPHFKKWLLQAVELFDEAYNDNFLHAFSGVDRLTPPQVFIGGGSGFVSKTVLYPLMGKQDGIGAAVEIFKQTGVSYKHKHHQDRGLGVSPHILKCTWYGGKTLQMGLCDLSIE